jgi:hypothetical protein
VTVKHGSAAHAFKLAEEYADFTALTQLCYQASKVESRDASGKRTKKLDQDAVKKRTNHYLDLYKQEFAFALYHYWIESGV